MPHEPSIPIARRRYPDDRPARRRILSRRAGIEGRFTPQRAREVAQARLERMAQCLRWLEEESFGIL
jgi:hypothetical protein